MSSEHEGGTSATICDSIYAAAQWDRMSGASAIHRGQLVSIAGEPGMHVYKVLAINAMREEVTIARVGDPSQSWRLPVSAVAAFD